MPALQGLSLLGHIIREVRQRMNALQGQTASARYPFFFVEEALAFWQKKAGDPSGNGDLLRELANGFAMEWVDLNQAELVDLELLARIPEHFAQTHQIIPLDRADQTSVSLAVATPFLGTVPLELAKALGRPVRLLLAQADVLQQFIETSYSSKGNLDMLSGLNDESLEDLDNIEDLKDMAQAAPVVKLVNTLFMEAIAGKASDIHVSPYENGLEVRYRIDGILQVATTVPRKYQAAIISRIKIMADLDIAERRVPQDGRIKLKSDNREYDIRVATTPTVFGEGAVMRILDKSSIQVSIEEVGFDPETLKKWLRLLARSNQVILVTGPTGSGKTTTLYASLNHVKSPELKLISIEDPVEYQLAGIDQIQVNSKINMTFAAALRSILRQDPDVIMVGEIRDGETAEIAVQSALTGHLVLSTLHTNDAPSAITRLIEMEVEPYLIASSVAGILAQRLVRKLCSCKKQDASGAWQPVGCELCRGTGYKGRMALIELLVVSDAICDLIQQKADASRIREQALQEGMHTIRSDGMRKVRAGLTTEAEVNRVAAE